MPLQETDLRQREEKLKIKEDLSQAALTNQFGATTAEIQYETAVQEQHKLKLLSASIEHNANLVFNLIIEYLKIL